jgi:RNA polymerase sigma factor (sigma-70 family)
MSLKSLLLALDEVAAELPFAVEDYEAANELFARWRKKRSPADEAVLMKWLYCYTQRYFVTRWMVNHRLPASQIEEPMTEAFRSCRASLERVRDPKRFASFVSVVCLNAFRSFCRKAAKVHLQPFHIDEHDRADEGITDFAGTHDRDLLLSAAYGAIERLPRSLQTPIRLRWLEGMDYDEIVATTGQSRATVRSYVRKALLRLREDPEIAVLLKELK